ncbi:MAG: methyltransferase domain-containing protein [bacterium]
MNKLQQPKNKYWYILGRQPSLAAAELSAVLKCKIKNQNSRIVELDKKINIKQLGGTVKIGKVLANTLTNNELEEKIIEELKKIQGKIKFGLSLYGKSKYDLKDIQKFGLAIKKNLKQQGCSVRYVQNRTADLSSAVVHNNKLIGDKGREFLITQDSDDKYSLAVTIDIQPFIEFSERDYGRPGRDDFSGMLPPKLAMIMINLAQTGKNKKLLDPFCGSGTILSEASLLGYKKLLGSDISVKAIADTEKNLDWIEKKYDITDVKCQLDEMDITQMSSQLKSTDSIVTEPYLGKPLKGRETRQEIENQTKELRRLYLIAFAEFKKTLKPGGVVVFIIPRFKHENEWININCKTEIERLGFKTKPLLPEHEFLIYCRPGQHLAREIWRFVLR